MTTALITGASSGIGLELSRIMAANGHDLIIVARSTDKLNQLKQELETAHSITVQVLPQDLSEIDAAAKVYTACQSNHWSVDILVNNAGFGEFGEFSKNEWAKEQRMIQVNCTCLVELCKLFGADMVANGSGRILNVASTAAFQPGPGMAVYGATKAFVLSFSEAYSFEIRDSGVTVTALCPGATVSGFQEAADGADSKLFKSSNLPSSRDVAEHGYKKMMRGKRTTIHGLGNWLLAQSVRFGPRNLVLWMASKKI